MILFADSEVPDGTKQMRRKIEFRLSRRKWVYAAKWMVQL